MGHLRSILGKHILVVFYFLPRGEIDPFFRGNGLYRVSTLPVSNVINVT